MNKVSIMIFSLLICAGAVSAQDTRHFLSLNAGFSVPMGDFSSQKEGIDAGFAKIGFVGGLEYDFYLGFANLAWSTNFNYIANDYESDTFSRGLDLQLYESGTYSTLSLMTGLKWKKELSDNVEAFVMGHVGYAMVAGPFLSGLPLPITDDSELVEFQMNRSSGICYSLGFGFLFNEHTYLAVRYLDAGKATFSKDVQYMTDMGRNTAVVGWSTPVKMLTISVGYTIAFAD
jgi:hypothetical protein